MLRSRSLCMKQDHSLVLTSSLRSLNPSQHAHHLDRGGWVIWPNDSNKTMDIFLKDAVPLTMNRKDAPGGYISVSNPNTQARRQTSPFDETACNNALSALASSSITKECQQRILKSVNEQNLVVGKWSSWQLHRDVDELSPLVARATVEGR